jgi:hypothetical protein
MSYPPFRLEGGSVRRSVIVATLVVAVAAGVLAPAMSGRSAASAGGWKVKIFSVGTPTDKFGTALRNKYVSGISVRFGWSGIEPRRGVFRWGPIDDAIASARRADKKVMIRVMAGIFTPSWVERRVRTLTFADDYLYNPAAYPDTVSMPVPWTSGFLSRWERFVRALGRRYDGRNTIYSIQIAGGGFLGEMTLPTDVPKWKGAGYTDRRYAYAWKQIIGFYRKAFPHTHLNLDIVEPFPDKATTNVVAPVVKRAMDARRKAWIQNNGLRPGMLGMIGPYRKVIRRVNDHTRVGYQMIAAMPTSTALHDAFHVALQDDASYVEVYATDVMEWASQTQLRYLATGGG